MNSSPTHRLRTVQIRTTAVAMVTVVVVLAVGAVGLLRFFEHQQVDQVDQRLSNTSRMLQTTLDSSATVQVPAAAAADALVQLVDKNGDVMFAPDKLRNEPAMRSVDPLDAASPSTATVRSVGRVRVIAIPFRDNWLVLAEPLHDVDDAVATLRAALIVSVPLLAMVLGLIVWFVVGRTLRPVHDAMERERRLVADVSHELRTPLAGARALLESESLIPAEIELNRLEALAALTRLEAMTEELLAEARNEHSGATHLEDLVDLDDVVLDVSTQLDRPEGITIDTRDVSAGQVRGNESDLARMVSNLIANGLRHAACEVRIRLDERDAMVRLIVEDDGPGIALEDRERVFERFTRLDDARARHGAGAGLGLPIARSVATAHGGTIRAGASPTGGASFTVILPASAPSRLDRPTQPVAEHSSTR